MDQNFIHEAEHNSLLKILDKNLEIPQDCTYGDQKVMDAEVWFKHKIIEMIIKIIEISPRNEFIAIRLSCRKF